MENTSITSPWTIFILCFTRIRPAKDLPSIIFLPQEAAKLALLGAKTILDTFLQLHLIH